PARPALPGLHYGRWTSSRRWAKRGADDDRARMAGRHRPRADAGFPARPGQRQETAPVRLRLWPAQLFAPGGRLEADGEGSAKHRPGGDGESRGRPGPAGGRTGRTVRRRADRQGGAGRLLFVPRPRRGGGLLRWRTGRCCDSPWGRLPGPVLCPLPGPEFVPSRARFRTPSEQDHQREQSLQCQLLRDIFGNPFRPVAIDPTWRTPPVSSLAQAAWVERLRPSGHLGSARLGILADALEEAGCSEADLLGHLHAPGPHLRGCWGLDLALARE